MQKKSGCWQEKLGLNMRQKGMKRKKRKKEEAITLDDMASSAFQKYSEAKNKLKKVRGSNGDIILIDNILHSIWSGVDVTMNGELISTMNQKYICTSLILKLS